MQRIVIGMLAATIVGMTASQSFALNEFKVEFKKKYIDTSKDDAFKALAKKESCSVCHIKKKKKKVENLNEYGKQLEKLVEGNANQRKKDARKEGGKEAADAEKAKLIKEIQKAFDEVAKKKSKAGDTFGDRIKNGLLPSSTDDASEDDKEKEKA